MLKKNLILVLICVFQTPLLSMNSSSYLISSTDSISPATTAKQLSTKEINNVELKDSSIEANSCFQVLEGRILNSKNNKPLTNSLLKLYLNGEKVQEATSKGNGIYNMKLLCNKTYELRISKAGFTEVTITFKTDTNSNTQIKKEFNLEETKCYQTISGTIKSAIDESVISGAFVSLLMGKENIKTVETLADGTYSFVLDCYKTYTIEVEQEHSFGNSILFNTSLVPEMVLVRHITLKEKLCKKTINGIVLNEQFNLPIRNAAVELSKDGTFEKSIPTNDAGKFTFNIPCNDVYTITVRKENYISKMRALETDANKKKTKNIKIKLKRTGCEQTIQGIVRNSHTNTPEAGVLLQLFNSDKLVETTTSAADGSYSFKATCLKSYKVTTTKRYFIDGTQYFVSGKTNNVVVKKLIKVSPILEFEEVREILMLKTDRKNLTFILNKDILTGPMIKELNRIVGIMEKYTYIRLEINIHTDSRGNDDLNMSLSKQRVENIIQYLISEGIESDRLSGDGYGESELLNGCSNGVKCKGFEHLQNRRVEFVVLAD